ncbi:MAG TPA: HAMP domain-containing protein, partial [Kofleriaceae bacterium]|nr:HAMP domain-containing protein [Kofleriaceae bacterium]
MSTPRHARAGISISVKLLLATSIVTAAALGIATWFSQTTIDDIIDNQLKLSRETREASIRRESELVVDSVANAVALPLVTNAYGEVEPLLVNAIKDDETSSDKRLLWLAVIDRDHQVVASTGKPPADLAKLANGLAAKTGVTRVQGATATDWVYSKSIHYNKDTIGQLVIGTSTANLEQALTAVLDDAETKAHRSRDRVILVSLVVLAIGVIVAALQGMRIARPIKALTLGAERISHGDLRSRVEDQRGDELGVLAKTFNLMAGEIARLLVEQAQKASLEKEMSLARQVQQAMLPPQTLDHHGYLKVVGYCMPASSCGGDWWTYRKLSN